MRSMHVCMCVCELITREWAHGDSLASGHKHCHCGGTDHTEITVNDISS